MENDYYYDNETIEIDWCETCELGIYLAVYSLTFVIGLLGNCLIIFTTIQYRRMQSVTNVFLTSLASADLLLIIICIPVKLAKLFSFVWTMGEFLCKTVHYMQNMSAICSVVTLTAISIERYYAIIHPMKAKYICTITQAKRIILMVWIMSIFLAIPTLFAQLHAGVTHRGKVYYICTRMPNMDSESLVMWRFHETYMLLVILLGPFCIMTFTYSMICREVWKVMKRRSIMTSEHALVRTRSAHEGNNGENGVPTTLRDDTKTVKQVVYMLIAVVILFALCWGPLLIDNVLSSYGFLPGYRTPGPLKYMNVAFNSMAYFNSCINPIIYGFMSKSFRESFLLLLSCSSQETRMQIASNYSLRYVSSTRNTTLK